MNTPAAHLRATPADLPPPVAAALDSPTPGTPRRVSVTGTDGEIVDLGLLEWGLATGSPILLVHGITNSARGWWRIAPALAAAGHRVIALDGPAHGTSRGWTGGVAFADTAGVVASLVRDPALGLDEAALAVVGHSWGSLVAAALPSATPAAPTAGPAAIPGTGRPLAPRRIVLLDPPFLSDAEVRALLLAAEVPATREAAVAALEAENPGWDPREVEVKAEQLLQFDAARLVRIILENHWDGGFRALDAAAAAGFPLDRYRVIRGIPALGGMLPDAAADRLAARIGAANVVTLADAPHSPQRTHPKALTLALLRAVA